MTNAPGMPTLPAAGVIAALDSGQLAYAALDALCRAVVAKTTLTMTIDERLIACGDRA